MFINGQITATVWKSVGNQCYIITMHRERRHLVSLCLYGLYEISRISILNQLSIRFIFFAPKNMTFLNANCDLIL